MTTNKGSTSTSLHLFSLAGQYKIGHSSRSSSIQNSKTTVDLSCLETVIDNFTKI